MDASLPLAGFSRLDWFSLSSGQLLHEFSPRVRARLLCKEPAFPGEDGPFAASRLRREQCAGKVLPSAATVAVCAQGLASCSTPTVCSTTVCSLATAHCTDLAVRLRSIRARSESMKPGLMSS